MVVPLSTLPPGQGGRIVWLAAEPEQENRLSAIGFAPDCSVKCLFKGRRHSMSAYMAHGSVFGLREQDAQVILVKIC